MGKITRKSLEQCAEQGLTQSETADHFKVQRQWISYLAAQHNITFKRKPTRLVELACPTCGVVRLLIPSDAKKRRSAYCKLHHARGLGTKRDADPNP